MATGLGYASQMGAIRETVFGTGVTAPLDRIPFLSETLVDTVKQIESNALLGTPGRTNSYLGSVPVQGQVVSELRYTNKSSTYFCGSDLLIAMAMHTQPHATLTQWALAANYNTLRLYNDCDKFFTLGIGKGVSVWNFISCFISKMTIEGGADENIKCTFEITARNINKADSPITLANLNSIAAVSGRAVTFLDGVLRLGTGAAALTTTHRIGIKKWKLELDNKLSDPDFTTFDSATTPASSTNKMTILPVRNGMREVTMEIELARYETTVGQAMEGYYTAGTPVQADFIFTGLDTDLATAATYKFSLPHLKVTECKSNIGGAEYFPQSIKLRAFRGASWTPAFPLKLIDASTAIVDEFAVEFDTERTAQLY